MKTYRSAKTNVYQRQLLIRRKVDFSLVITG
jgi:hypothetical protein